MRKTQRQEVKKWKGKAMRVPQWAADNRWPQKKQIRAQAAASPWLVHLAYPLPVCVLSYYEGQHALLGEPAVLLTCTNDLSIGMRRITNSFFPYTEGCQGRSVGLQRAIRFLSRRENCSTNRMQTLPSISVHPEHVANGPFTRTVVLATQLRNVTSLEVHHWGMDTENTVYKHKGILLKWKTLWNW